MKKQINVKGLACPQPVLNVKKELEQSDITVLEVISDSDVSKENIVRLANNLGHSVLVTQQGNEYTILITKNDSVAKANPPVASPTSMPTTCESSNSSWVVYISSDTIGQGDVALGEILMRSFLKTLLETKPLPSKMLFVNRGIFLTTQGSAVLNTLKELAQKGVVLLSCGTCLDFYHRKEILEIGSITNMMEIVESLRTACKIVQP